jgi:hypothetical protein
MVAMNILFALYIAVLIIVFCLGLYRFKMFDKASRIFCFLIAFILCTEICAFYARLHHHHSASLYSISIIIQTIIVCIYFNYGANIFRRRHIGIYAGVFTLAIGIIDKIYFEQPGKLNYYFIVYAGFCTICMSLLAFYEFLIAPDSLRLPSYPHFC